MSNAIPIFRSQDQTYRADSCGQLAKAAEEGAVRFAVMRHGHYPGRSLPAGVLPGIKMAGFWDAPNDQEWGLPWHYNEGLELTFLERGNLFFSVADRDYRLGPDDLTISRPWQRHRVGNPYVTASRLHWIILDVGVRRPNQEWRWPSWLLLSPPDLEELSLLLRHNEESVYRSVPGVRECFLQIAAAVEASEEASAVSHLAVRVNDLFLRVLEGLRKKRIMLDESLTSSRRTVELFLNDLVAHPEHLSIDWTVEEMASHCGLKTTQFVHHVRSLTNMAPLHYLNRCRLEHAARLLREKPQEQVTSIALECGFSSSQYFATVFSRKFGCAPSAYRGA